MKSWWLLLMFGVLVCGCKDAGKERSGDLTAEKSPAGEKPKSSAENASSNAKPTLEQLASIVRVRVAVGGFPPVESTGALLHRNEFNGFIPAGSKDRLVLAYLPNWSEDQLRGPQAQIVVLRNMSNNRGKQVATWNPARLLQFDPKNRMAVLTYLETFEAGADAGFRLSGSDMSDASTLLVSTAPYVAPGNRRLPWADPGSEPFVVAASHYRSGLTSVDSAHAGAKSAVDDHTILLAVRATDLLTGFIAFPKNGAPQIASVDKVTISSPRFNLEPRGVSLRASRTSTQSVEFTIIGEQTGTAGERSVWAQIVEVPSQGVDLTQEKEVHRVLKTSLRKVRLTEDPDKPGEWRGSIAGVVLGEQETAYLVQPLWKLFPDSVEPSVRGTPFIVRFQRKEEGVFPSVEGLPDLSPKLSVMAQVPTKKFDLEAPVRTIHPIRGGSEVLIELENAPFWKRFSFTQNDCLPLPPVQLSTASLSGNLDALFVLDRGTMEVRKYFLSDLSIGGLAKLPNNVKAYTVLSGCNSDRAPVYVLSGNSVVALSPKDLHTLAIPTPSSLNPHELHQFNFSNQASYIVSGDGLSFWVLEDGSFQGVYSYRDDIRGVRSRYFDLQTHYSPLGGGVSGAYGVRDWLYSVATPGGVVLNATPPANPGRSHDWASLATNSPVIFHRRLGSDHAIPPSPTIVECFSFFDPQPFAEVAAPELAEVVDTGAPNVSSRRWITFDPSTFRLGTLAAERKQWIVRDLAQPEKRAQPVLLNWPNASIFRGEEFRFRPVLAGGSAKISAEIVGSPGMASVNSAGEVTFRVAADQPASTLLLSLSVEGENGSKLTYPIPLHLADPPALLAAPLTVEAAQLASYSSGFKFLGNVVNGVRALPTTLHRFKDPLVDAKGPIAGHLVLITATNRIDFFSPKPANHQLYHRNPRIVLLRGSWRAFRVPPRKTFFHANQSARGAA